MRKWEDIVRDKLGGYASNLPEDSLAAFHARRATAGATKAKRFPLIWAIVPAIAAGLAAVLLLRKPTVPEEGIQRIPQPVEVYGQVDDSLDTVTPLEATPLIAQAVPKKAVRPMPRTEQPEERATSTVAEESRLSEETLIPETDDFGPGDTPEEPAIDSRPVVQDSSPFVPQPSTEKPAVQVNLGTGGAIAAGGGLLAALATQLARADVSGLVPGVQTTDDINNTNSQEIAHTHRKPLVVGLSVKFPVSEKIGITTGLEYSLYSSSFQYPTGEKTQLVHDLGVPVRLDWAFVSSRWLDVYLGAGVKGVLCLGATLDGEAIGKDGSAFRLLGAGGIQFNATRNVGFFVEPAISWTLPSDRRVLSTYNSEHPWMFTVVTGVRIHLGK